MLPQGWRKVERLESVPPKGSEDSS
jgi:hypothetical protein